MASKRRRTRIGRRGEQTSADDIGTERRLGHLRQSFAQFRREHRAGTRIPQALRDGALQALGLGAPEREVLRACCISSSQFELWRRRQRACAQGLELGGRNARVFPVVDDVPGVAVDRVSDHESRDVQLRIGGWAISIGRVEE
jgi:hypothetical protein